MATQAQIITIAAKQEGMRLDKALSDALPEFSRSRLQALIREGAVTLNTRPVTSVNHAVRTGEEYALMIPDVTPLALLARPMDLVIMYEDAHMLVVDKPAGLTVHPAPGHPDDTLVNGLLAHCGESLSGIGGVARPGIVHRLDKDTSGLMVVAKTDQAHQGLAAQLADRSLKRIYHAVIWGALNPSVQTIEGAIGRSPRDRKKMAVVTSGGKDARTHVETLARFGQGYQLKKKHCQEPAKLSPRLSVPKAQQTVGDNLLASLITCRLETGRTHQIRVHLSHIGHPLIGDPAYGRAPKASIMKQLPENLHNTLTAFARQALHAHALTCIHPVTKKTLSFEVPPPEDFAQLVTLLEAHANIDI